MSSLVQHQNHDLQGKVLLGQQSYSIDGVTPSADEADLAIRTTPCEGGVELLMCCSSRSVGSTMAEKLYDVLYDTIHRIVQDPGQPALPESMPHECLPLPQPQTNGSLCCTSCDKKNPTNVNNAPLIEVIKEGWRRVLAAPELVLDGETNFFEVGGDLVCAALLAGIWEREGYKVTVEALIDHPQLRDMARVLSISQ
jgi:aryl carrier-like protein